MQVYSLYNGTVTLTFDEVKHRYLYNGEVKPGVTTVTDSAFDKSGPLMGWALNQAVQYLKENWPIDGRIPLNSQVFTSLTEGMKKAHHRKKKQAADVGTIAHEWIEAYIKSSLVFGPTPELPTDPSALHAVNSYLQWERENHVVYLASERKVFSVEWEYAGTLDIFAIVNGVHMLLDIKTSNSYRHEYAVQTAAYLKAMNEEDGTNVRERIILMLPKDGESKVNPIVRGPELYDADVQAFKNALDNYRWLKNQ